jgi:hypothetical protein
MTDRQVAVTVVEALAVEIGEPLPDVLTGGGNAWPPVSMVVLYRLAERSYERFIKPVRLPAFFSTCSRMNGKRVKRRIALSSE